MTDSRQRQKLDFVAGENRRLGVRAAERDRNRVVVLAVDQKLRDAERKQFGRRRERVAPGIRVGWKAKELLRGTAAEPETCRRGEIGHARLRRGMRDDDARRG